MIFFLREIPSIKRYLFQNLCDVRVSHFMKQKKGKNMYFIKCIFCKLLQTVLYLLLKLFLILCTLQDSYIQLQSMEINVCSRESSSKKGDVPKSDIQFISVDKIFFFLKLNNSCITTIGQKI